MSGNRDVAAEKNRVRLGGYQMGTMPAVSVIVPTHNRPHLLSEALASLIAQKESRWEAIIVDDASDIPVDIRPYGDQLRGRARVFRQRTRKAEPQPKTRALPTRLPHWLPSSMTTTFMQPTIYRELSTCLTDTGKLTCSIWEFPGLVRGANRASRPMKPR